MRVEGDDSHLKFKTQLWYVPVEVLHDVDSPECYTFVPDVMGGCEDDEFESMEK